MSLLNETLLYVDRYGKGTRLLVETDAGLTVMKIFESGLEPLVDIIKIPEGVVSGPVLKFLGSVASRDALEADMIHTGEIIKEHSLAVEVNQKPHLLTGNVKSIQIKGYRMSRR